MNRTETCEFIRKVGIIPAIRVSSAEEAHFAAECIEKGGIPIVEITMTVPDAVKLIAHLVSHHSSMVVGAGTVLDTDTAQQCVDAGARFLTAPSLDSALIDFAAHQELAVLPGAMTPTEIVTAWRAGGDFVKIFPCAQIGGDKYIKALKAALPQIHLIAAGGVNQQTAVQYMLAGASAIGVGHELIPPEAIELREAGRIRELARRFMSFVKEARERMPAVKESSTQSEDFWKHHKHPHKKEK